MCPQGGWLLPCLEWCCCRKHWTASGTGNPSHHCQIPWWRSSEEASETPGESTALVGRGQRAEVQELCVRSDLNLTQAPRGSENLGASGLYILIQHELEVLRKKEQIGLKSSPAQTVKSGSVSQQKPVCTFNWSLSGVVELQDRYSRKPSPEVQTADTRDPQGVTPAAAYLHKQSTRVQWRSCRQKWSVIDSPEGKYLESPSSWSGKLKVDDSSRVGNIQELCETLLNTNFPTFRKTKKKTTNYSKCRAYFTDIFAE